MPGRSPVRPAAAGQQDGGVHREGRGPDAALRAEEGDDLAALPVCAVESGLDLAGPDEQRHDAALELAAREAAGDHVVRAGLEEGDPRLHVMRRRDDEDRA